MSRYLITSALPYINGVKHLGNLIGSILPADVYAKFLRQQGENVLYICGTDEHGTAPEIAAKENNQSTQDYCDKMFEVQKNIYQKFNINFDYFGRSSSSSNHELTKEIFLSLKENGYIESKETRHYYSIEDERFLPDRYVEGICPHCKYEKARGDQCDGCGVLLEPTDLINPYSSISGSKNIELRNSTHFFLSLDKLTNKLEKWTSQHEAWPDVVKGIIKKWLNEGLKPRCITRDLKWGIQVPIKGYEDKVFYVWFDAPNAYVSITQDWAQAIGKPNEWKNWWLDEDVNYIQFMGKDNVAFHAIIWPAMILGSDIGWKKVDYIKGFHWLTYEKGKFSTSQKRGIFTDTALDLFPADYWRYYLLANCPESSDSDFTFQHFASIVNKDLAGVLGNFASRSLALLQKHFDGKITIELSETNYDQNLIADLHEIKNKYVDSLENLKFRQAAQYLRSLWVLGNEYITKCEPWVTIKSAPEKAAVTLSHCVHLLRLFSIASYPFIPASSAKILDMLNDPQKQQLPFTNLNEGLDFSYYKNGHVLNMSTQLFNKIDDEQVEKITSRYAGKEENNFG